MATEFICWADGCEQHLRSVGNQISELCGCVRGARANTARIDSRNNKKIGNKGVREISANLRDLLGVLEAGNFVAMQQKTASIPEEINDGCTPFRPEVSDGIHTDLCEVINDIASLDPDQAEMGRMPRPRSPGLLQKGGRYFANLSGAFQLQDCFEQRVDHISLAIAKVARESEHRVAPVLEVLNTQVAGLAGMIVEFSETANDSVPRLIELNEKRRSDSSSEFQLTSDLGARIIKEVILPLEELIACNAKRSIEKRSGFGVEVSDDDASGLGGDSEAARIVEIEGLLKQLKGLHSEHFDTVDDEGDLLEINFVEVGKANDRLHELATELIDFTAQFASENEATEMLSPDVAELLESIQQTFTMDVERADYSTALHRMGVK